MPDALKAGWVRIKRTGSDEDAPTAVVTTGAWERKWSKVTRPGDDGNPTDEKLWELVGDESGPEQAKAIKPTVRRATAPVTAEGGPA